ncbi:MAG: 4-hydroxy-tetrahydrodipicolinate reductase [Halanaerobiales bacterium]
MSKKRIIVNGAAGRMGKTICQMVINQDNYELVGAVDVINRGQDIFKFLGIDSKKELYINEDVVEEIEHKDPDVVIDFTNPEVVMDNIKKVLKTRTNMVVGTTGFDQDSLKTVEELAKKHETSIMIAPNFALGAVMMMEFSKKAAQFFNQAEIVELHHDGKMDAPSGTAVKTAEMIAEHREKPKDKVKRKFIENLTGARGAEFDDIHIHSVRLQGLVAHQEVIFGGQGQTLKIRHDSVDRKSFMPGIKLAVNNIDDLDGLVYGLEKIMEI